MPGGRGAARQGRRAGRPRGGHVQVQDESEHGRARANARRKTRGRADARTRRTEALDARP